MSQIAEEPSEGCDRLACRHAPEERIPKARRTCVSLQTCSMIHNLGLTAAGPTHAPMPSRELSAIRVKSRAINSAFSVGVRSAPRWLCAWCVCVFLVCSPCGVFLPVLVL